ncbi:hypothetical protein [Paraburkholderia sp. C35]|uniref:hypothetical protein n=1 Tax=Paraburkholderia sp. C35 TaxID=2126993 RepID=UPI0013A54A4C|nr:hypothetical protein [Paraburkholderia sp. C35]
MFGHEQIELLSFTHVAIRAPRADVIGEVVMAEKWQEYMQRLAPSIHDECDEYGFRSLMASFPFPLTQRLATVAASFIQWLGTNCGRCFLGDAEKAAKALDNRHDAYAAAWALENVRHLGINGGVRTIEAALAPKDHYQYGALKRLPDLTEQDYEAVEHVVLWLGMREGKAFIAECEREITQRLDAQRHARIAEWRKQNTVAHLREKTKLVNKRDEWR